MEVIGIASVPVPTGTAAEQRANPGPAARLAASVDSAHTGPWDSRCVPRQRTEEGGDATKPALLCAAAVPMAHLWQRRSWGTSLRHQRNDLPTRPLERRVYRTLTSTHQGPREVRKADAPRPHPILCARHLPIWMMSCLHIRPPVP